MKKWLEALFSYGCPYVYVNLLFEILPFVRPQAKMSETGKRVLLLKDIFLFTGINNVSFNFPTKTVNYLLVT